MYQFGYMFKIGPTSRNKFVTMWRMVVVEEGWEKREWCTYLGAWARDFGWSSRRTRVADGKLSARAIEPHVARSANCGANASKPSSQRHVLLTSRWRRAGKRPPKAQEGPNIIG